MLSFLGKFQVCSLRVFVVFQPFPMNHRISKISCFRFNFQYLPLSLILFFIMPYFFQHHEIFNSDFLIIEPGNLKTDQFSSFFNL